MPLRNGTGPGNRGQGKGRGRRGLNVGPAGNCICPVCGEKKPHKRGVPCPAEKCPKCGSAMTRE